MDQKQFNLSFDPKADVLYCSFGEPREALSIELENGLVVRMDPRTDEVVGVTMLDFMKRTFQMASGVSLERELNIELSAIKGVRDVDITSTAGGLEVNVVLNELEFSVFEQVIQKELDLFDQSPDLRAHFNVFEPR